MPIVEVAETASCFAGSPAYATCVVGAAIKQRTPMKTTVTNLAHMRYMERNGCTAPHPLLKRSINELNGLCETRKYFVPKYKAARNQQEQPCANSQSNRVAAGERNDFTRNCMQVWTLFHKLAKCHSAPPRNALSWPFTKSYTACSMRTQPIQPGCTVSHRKYFSYSQLEKSA